METDINTISSTNLEELEELQEIIDDRIGALKGEESLKNHDGYTTEEVKEYLKECLKK